MSLRAMASRSSKDLLLAGIGLVWVVGLGVGLRATLNYEDRPSGSGASPTSWPSQSKVLRVAGLPTIVVLAHPLCPCTRATVGELALVMTKLHKRATAVVVFVRPEGTAETWERTDLWHDAAQIPGVTVMEDPGGKEATLFGALASGQTLLYDVGGRLLFSGGITASRGHFGDNAGATAIAALVTTGRSDITTTPVYGCYLRNPEAAAKDGGGAWSQESSKKKD